MSSNMVDGDPNLAHLVNGHNGLAAQGRFRGVSVDRHREYKAPQYYEDTYYKRDPYDSSGDDRARYDSLPGRHKGAPPYHNNSDIYDGFDDPLEEDERFMLDGEQRTIFKLERQWSHPNLRPRPRGAGRRLPKTPGSGGMMAPNTPSATMLMGPNTTTSTPHQQDDILLEWVENERMRRTPKLGNQRSFESDYSPPRNCRDNAYSPSSSRPESKQPTSTSVIRRTPISERRLGTGRMLPKPPPGGSHLVLNAAQAKPNRGLSRERKLPKPSSLEIRNPSRELPCRSTSINFPRIDTSPTRMSNFIDGTSIIPSLPPTKKTGYSRQMPTID